MSKILALETTDKNGSVAVWDGTQLLRETVLQQRSAQSLAPAIAEILEAVGWKSGDVQCVAVATGPGSFTGLRVGIATAKMYAYAVNAEIVGVNTLLAIAAAVGVGNVQHVSVAIDAQRGDVAAQNFRLPISDDIWELPEPIGERTVIPATDWWDFGKSETQDESVMFVGPILARIAKNCPACTNLCEDESIWFPQAKEIAKIAMVRMKSNQPNDLWTLAPYYSRLSAAEERLHKPRPC